MTRWVVIVSAAIPFVFVDDDDELRVLEERESQLADVVVVRIDLDVAPIDASSAYGACER
jgi:hypothetical protein